MILDMLKRLRFAALGLAACAPLPFANPVLTMAEAPPVAPVRPVVDDYFGTKYSDAYRYMEQFTDPEVQKWVKGQAEYAAKSLEAIPGRAALLKRIDELDAGAPFTITNYFAHPHGNTFYFKQAAGDDVAKLYVQQSFFNRDGTRRPDRLLVDPTTFPKANPGDHFTLSFFCVSPGGIYVLYGYAASGSEQTTLKIVNVATGEELPDTIDRIEAEYALPSWRDDKSFFYSRRRKLGPNDPPTEGYKFTQAFHHMLGDDPEKDPLVFGRGAPGSPEFGPMDFPAVIVRPESAMAIGQVKHGDETDITLYTTTQADVSHRTGNWQKVCDRSDQVTDFALDPHHIYLLTAKDAPRFQVVRVSTIFPLDFARKEVVVPPGDYVVDSLALARDALYVGVIKGTANKVLRVPRVPGAGRMDIPVPHQELQLPREPGSSMVEIPLPADEPSATIECADLKTPGAWLRTKSWIRAAQLRRYDPNYDSKPIESFPILPVGKFDSPEGLMAREVMVQSHDGVFVPLSIIHHKDIQLDGTNPTLLQGYGAYGHTMSMNYDPTSLAWLERGGVLAYAHVRGGGAFGKAWHHAGRKLTKPNTWKDFIACAEYLVNERYTSPAKLAGRGGSAGGILIGRAITDRPDLFAAANIAVGCVDMLRFETTMNGPPNVPEFGTITKEDELRGLWEMSTLQHIVDGTKYPAVILTHGINDPRVEPWQSAKATARFQAAQQAAEANAKDARPVLFRVDYHSGHGIGSTRTQRHEERADVWSFFLWQFGETGFQPK